MRATMTIREALEHSGMKILEDYGYFWHIEYNGKRYMIAECQNFTDWETRFHITEWETGEKLCTRANYRTAMRLIKNR